MRHGATPVTPTLFNPTRKARSPLTLGKNIASRLYRSGYVLIRGWRREETTIAIGQSIGAVVDIHALLPQNNIASVQTLEPRTEAASSLYRYSGVFGLNEFPLHTDLAHWMRPPRYFVLRCQNGSQAVTTRLLASSTLASVLGARTLGRALVRPRRRGPNTALCLLPLVFFSDGVYAFRWDSLFLVPMNEAAHQVAKLMRTQAWHLSEALTLAESGDTLIVDNWRVLHGRSKVPLADIDRRLERVYLSEIHT